MVKIVRNENDLKIGIEIIDEKSKELFNHDSKIKKIFEGCLWAEGPVYLEDKNLIVWSDIPFNRMLYYDISKGNTGVYINNSEYSNGNSIDLDGNHYVDARVYNIKGQEVAVLHNGLLSGSAQTLSWVATNQASGIYFIQVVVDGVTTVNNKVVLLK